jgi:hypothetical protein
MSRDTFIQLLTVSKRVMINAVCYYNIDNFFCLGDKFHRIKYRVMWNTARNGNWRENLAIYYK